jgi:phosphoenolpyruvate carboxylase
MGIAALYAALAWGLGLGLYERIREEYELTVSMVLGLRGNQALLDSDRDLQRSLHLRNPYMDPLNLMQVDLLRRWREGGRGDQSVLQALLETVGGIAQAMQNTG